MTDAILGFPGTFYPTGGGFGFRGTAEVGAPTDVVTLSNDLRTVTVTTVAFDFGIDQMRIITAVPEPTALALFAFGLGGLGFMMRRRRAMQFKAA